MSDKPINTHVINLFAGSGAGKSTTAAGIFYLMKLHGFKVELVREYVKGWAWAGKPVGEFDQAYLLGKQSQYESALYGKVDYIVTDSPLLLSGIYESYYGDGTRNGSTTLALEFCRLAEQRGVTYHNFWIERTKEFVQHGRYETEEQAREVDRFMQKYLEVKRIPLTRITAEDKDKARVIIEHVINHPLGEL